MKFNIPEYGVTQFNRSIKEVIENNFDYLRIKGEISEIKTATRGQLYLTLKDDESILSGVIWEQKKKNLKIQPELGMEIIVTGKITTWSKYKTTYQIDIDKLELSGEGALLKIIEERKKKLKSQGLFDVSNKKPLPFLPSKIGVITSPTGSVIHDIINRIKDRFIVDIDVWPAAVQGAGAAETIIEAINGFNSKQLIDKPDVIIIARGGGSTEDLMPFNDEKLAFAVYKSSIPVISAVGHETDTTIIDFVADVRSSTPTAAAEISVPVKSDLVHNVSSLDQRLNFLLKQILNSNENNLENLKKLLKAPNLIINIFKEKINKNFNNLNSEISNQFTKKKLLVQNLQNTIKPPLSKLELNNTIVKNLGKDIENKLIEIKSQSKEKILKFNRLLYSNSINANLKKGYSVLTSKNKLLKNSTKTKKGELIKAHLEKGKIDLIVKKIN